jgi:DNA modification methylase
MMILLQRLSLTRLFGINYQNNFTHKMHDKIENDAVHFDYTDWAKEAYRILRPDSALFAFTCWSEYPLNYKEVESVGFAMKEPIICQKRASGKTDLFGSFQTNSDWIMFAHKGRFRFRQTQLVKNKKAGVIPNKGRKPVPEYKTRLPSCWFGEEYPWSSENSAFQKANNVYHPTIKSVEFLKWLILISTDEGDTIVDPFVGSGSTIVAAKATNRHFIACDINHVHCETAEKRCIN